MRRAGSWIVPLILAVTVGACAAPRGGAPASNPATSAAEAEWERLVQAAKKEGTVSVIIPTGSDVRAALVEPFQEKYGITVDPGGREG